MRPGLVAVGAAFAVIGAGVLVSVLYTADAPSVERNGSVAVQNLGPGNWTLFTVPATSQSSATLSLHWSSSAAVAVNWYLTVSCQSASGWCIETAPVASWFGNTSGSWGSSGGAIALYVLWVQDTANTPVNFSAAFAESYHPTTLTLLPIPLAVVLAGGSLLAGTGAVAIYLGLFLPTGVFSSLDGMSDDFLYGGIDERDEPSEPPAPPP